ncbi:hypothetical protein TVAG_492760 [Trichomonas vaginalis G3]|uniref:EamA domain-containing protein n=1 Tax=Trichomonas vaginalis (strain ATCC PRA-98 / G3) TaxID=412133 RepID=A2F8J2_TRIV3|nr:negative regulation of mitochondrial outer membrane permeabilization protein [Trichomonas vaginalis G3]EAX98785.1 hypothetical protein TVAG_492760 [Trichomonas vaginalis G3]KAI5483858.1 negative regulation of mitochondrial outer membrane permeabilization protein [Trichomonas vaginalis G3]|eukprot:XP_001311715.1 hypothetical protein [Trichomonas vaginalis G3]
MVSLAAELALAGLMLSTGSLNTISKKVMYQTSGTTIDGGIELYRKPWLCTLVMFCGESMCMLFFYLFALYFKCTKKKVEDEIISSVSEVSDKPAEPKIQFVTREETESNPTGGLNWKFPFFVTLFASCDLLSTTFTGIGLVYCNASVIQILRGFVIVFTMLFAWVFLGRKPKLNQVVGVLFALLGLCMVGGSAVASDATSGKEQHSVMDTLLGIGLTLLSQVFSSIQFVFEEKLLKGGQVKPIPSLFLVGSEGVAGAILSIAVALPIVNAIPGKDHGSYENLKNSVYMLFHNTQITVLQFLYFISIAFFNWSSFVYSKALSATARTLVDACRTIVVWATMASIFYPTHHKYGEGVTLWSILQGCGFVMMLLGTTTHNNIAGVGDKVTGCCKKEEKLDPQPLLKN